jgi:PAS domain S-box-containing protein
VESVQDYAIFMLDPDGYVVSWNEGARRIKGYTPEEIIGQHFSVFYPPEDLQSDIPASELADAKANGHLEVEGWRLRKDGSKFWATVVITALFDADGTHRGFAKVTRDTTERTRAQEDRRSLDALRLRQRHALELNDDIIQGLAVADLALNLEEYDKARGAISSTLQAARRYVTDLLGEPGEAIPIAPGDLRKGDRRTGT